MRSLATPNSYRLLLSLSAAVGLFWPATPADAKLFDNPQIQKERQKLAQRHHVSDWRKYTHELATRLVERGFRRRGANTEQQKAAAAARLGASLLRLSPEHAGLMGKMDMEHLETTVQKVHHSQTGKTVAVQTKQVQEALALDAVFSMLETVEGAWSLGERVRTRQRKSLEPGEAPSLYQQAEYVGRANGVYFQAHGLARTKGEEARTNGEVKLPVKPADVEDKWAGTDEHLHELFGSAKVLPDHASWRNAQAGLQTLGGFFTDLLPHIGSFNDGGDGGGMVSDVEHLALPRAASAGGG